MEDRNRLDVTVDDVLDTMDDSLDDSLDDADMAAGNGESVGDAALDETSQPYIGRWNQLVSTTNWEKGRIILQWREALVAAGSPAVEFSDEAWARRVGGVTGQHVGRLRRVYQRFGPTYETYAGLYWSHFQAALEWEDAEMWLEGAMRSQWSVSRMRRQRWETLNDPAAAEPRDEEIVSGELDEDFEPALNDRPTPRTLSASYDEVQGPPIPEGPDFGDEDERSPSRANGDSNGAAIDSEDEEAIEFVRPFENLRELPDDLAEAFESFKLAILRHKLDGWQQISREDLLASLDALKELALAPSTENASRRP